jgi:hypothetical protein
MEPQSLREVFSFHSDDGFLKVRRRSPGPEMSEQEGNHN